MNIKSFALSWLLFLSLDCFSQTMHMYDDGPAYDATGYGICNGSENGEYNLIKQVVFPGAVVFDLGANIGSWSEAVLATEKNVTIYAFEPIPSTYETLKKRLSFPNCFLYNVAISDQTGIKDFHIYANEIQEHHKELIQVNTQDLDSFCKEHAIAHIDFLKIDTEGAELSILKGAQHLLSNHAIPVIQFEYGGTYSDANITLKEVYDLLSVYNYAIYRIIPNGLIKIGKWRSELETFQYSNYVAILNTHQLGKK